MKDILAWHAAAHPSMQAQDAIKLCYQAAFGAEHLLTDPTRAWAYFEREWDSAAPSALPLWEAISSRYGRVDLAAWKQTGMPREWLFRMFFLTASAGHAEGTETLQGYLDLVSDMARAGKFPFSPVSWERTRTAYEQSGGGAVHHSESYRLAEHPTYRVIDRQYLRLIPLLQRLAVTVRPAGDAVVIAIDGRAASGKTTTATQLAAILDAGVVHMDDFFLPPELRTPQRLSEAGGNVHYERFAEQVIPHLRSTGAFSYPCFDCSQMKLAGEREVSAGTWRIVEGSYSHHPALKHDADIRIFCHVDPQEQMRRIFARNGEQMAQMFAQRWIPMEEQYFEAFHIRESADMEITL